MISYALRSPRRDHSLRVYVSALLQHVYGLLSTLRLRGYASIERVTVSHCISVSILPHSRLEATYA